MTNVLVIGATGIIGQKVVRELLDKTDDYLTLMARNTSLVSIDEKRERVVQGDVIDDKPLDEALEGNETVVLAADSNLAFSMQRIINAMDGKNIKRFLFITSMGKYNEIPVKDGASGNLTEGSILQPYKNATDLLEDSDLNYTIVRPAQFDASKDIDYVVTHNGGAQKSNDVSVNSVVDLVVKLVNDNSLDAHDNLAISRVA